MNVLVDLFILVLSTSSPHVLQWVNEESMWYIGTVVDFDPPAPLYVGLIFRGFLKGLSIDFGQHSINLSDSFVILYKTEKLAVTNL